MRKFSIQISVVFYVRLRTSTRRSASFSLNLRWAYLFRNSCPRANELLSDTYHDLDYCVHVRRPTLVYHTFHLAILHRYRSGGELSEEEERRAACFPSMVCIHRRRRYCISDDILLDPFSSEWSLMKAPSSLRYLIGIVGRAIVSH